MSVDDVREALARVETALDDAYHELQKVEQEAADALTLPVKAGAPFLSPPGDPRWSVSAPTGSSSADPTETADQSAPSAPSYNPGAAEDTGA